MKKRICDLTSGTPFKYNGRVFIKDAENVIVCLTDGSNFDPRWGVFPFDERESTLVTVCKRIRKSDIKERK